MKKILLLFRKVLKIALAASLISLFLVLSINLFVIYSTNRKITEVDHISEIGDSYDVGLILGCAVYGDRPSPMLKERLDAGIELYMANKVAKLLMSGDNLTPYYKEVDVMKKYAIEKGVSEEDILVDHAGLSTYDSMYRAVSDFDLNNFIIVSQKYHLHRALFISEQLGVSSIGVSADKTVYSGQSYREFREILARNKDFVKSFQKPKAITDIPAENP